MDYFFLLHSVTEQGLTMVTTTGYKDTRVQSRGNHWMCYLHCFLLFNTEAEHRVSEHLRRASLSALVLSKHWVKVRLHDLKSQTERYYRLKPFISSPSKKSFQRQSRNDLCGNLCLAHYIDTTNGLYVHIPLGFKPLHVFQQWFCMTMVVWIIMMRLEN